MEPFPNRHLTYNYLLPINSWLLLSPSHLCCDWTMGTIPVISSIIDHRNLVTVLFYLILGRFIVYMLQKQDARNRAVIMVMHLHHIKYQTNNLIKAPTKSTGCPRVITICRSTYKTCLGFEFSPFYFWLLVCG